MSAAVFVISGRDGVGKTAFVERIIPALKEAGLTVTTIKTSSKPFVPAYPASDIHRHQQAGADRAILAQPGGTFVVKPAIASFEELLTAERERCDVLLLEGAPIADFPVIEVARIGVARVPDDDVWLTVTDRTVGRENEVETPGEAAEKMLERLELAKKNSVSR